MRPEAAGSAGRAGSGVPGHRVQVRWRDLDGLGHVNHTVVLTYLEEGRDAWLESHGIRRDEYVVGRCSVDFRREIDPAFKAVTVQCGVRQLGRSSLTTTERIVEAREAARRSMECHKTQYSEETIGRVFAVMAKTWNGQLPFSSPAPMADASDIFR